MSTWQGNHSIPCNTQRNIKFTSNQSLLVYMRPIRILENTYKGFKGSQRDTSGGALCQKETFQMAGDNEFYLGCIRPLRTSVDPAGHTLRYLSLFNYPEYYKHRCSWKEVLCIHISFITDSKFPSFLFYLMKFSKIK